MRLHGQRTDSTDRPSGRKRRIALASACGATLVTALTFAATASPASASIKPLGCGTTAVTLYNGNTIIWSKSCSSTGDEWSVPNLWTTKLAAHGWSGAAYGTDGKVFWFCDNQTIPINDYIRQVFLNATKPSRCK